jgi:DNA-binding NarL/FixJ family response regulator
MGERARIVKADSFNKAKRVVIIDDHPLIRKGLERLINTGDRFQICGEAGNAAEGMKIIGETKPDLAIVDISLPDADGIDLTGQIVKEFPSLRILILSMHDESSCATRALKAGASGYMVKQDAAEKIEIALEEVSNGRTYLSPGIAQQLSRR